MDSALEAVSEFLPFDRLLKIPDITPETVSDMVKEVILSSVKEIPEELASSIGSTLADILIRRDGSDFVRTMNEAKAEGRTGGQAFWYALGQEGLDLLREAAVTFLSGNLSGAATVGAKTLMHSQADPASSLTAPQGTAADPGGDPSHHPDADPTGQTDPTGQQTPQTQASPDGNTKQTVWETYLEAIQDYFFPQKAGDQSGQSAARNAMANTQPGAVQLPGTAQSAMQAQTPGAQNQTQAPGTKPGSGVSNFWNTYMDAVRSYFFPQNAGTQTATQTEIQAEAQAAQTSTRAAAQTQPQDAMQSGMQPQIQGTMQPDGQPQTQGTAQPNFQTQVPGESQPNAQAQTEKGQPLSPEKRIADLASDIKKSGLTTGKATIAAQEMVTEAEKRFGANSDAVLDAYEPGQNPRQFLNGFQNAYILGTQGNQAALEKSKAAAYLTQEQRETAYELGSQSQGQNLAQNQLDSADSGDIIAAGSVYDNFDRKIKLMEPSEDLKLVNPNYSTGEYQWRNNCQRCVAAYEMRRRGYNVTAKPIVGSADTDLIAKNWYKVWGNDPPIACRNTSGKTQIETLMSNWKDGARAIICVQWKRSNIFHVFVAEQTNGKTVYLDPQTGNEDCSWYFDKVQNGSTSILRIDNRTPKEEITECCENRR